MKHSKNSHKICLITSKGGHLYELLQLNKLLKRNDRFWVTGKGLDTKYYLKNEKVYYGYFPESRNIINLFRNFILAIKILNKEKPGILLSCGAGIAVPFFVIGKLFFSAKLIYIESYDFVNYPSLTGKILYNITDLFLIQHKIQQKWFLKAKFWGSLL